MAGGEFFAFSGRLVRPDWAETVVSPPYDALNATERRAYAAENPDTFLHVTRSPEDAGDEDAASPSGLAAASRQAAERLVGLGAYGDSTQGVYLYRLRTADHEQTGIVLDVAVDAFESDRIRGHETTRPLRAEVLAHSLDLCGAMSSPVALMYRPDTVMANAIERWSVVPPDLEFTSHGVLHQTVWRVDDPQALDLLHARLAGRPLYITDGHHRAAAASVVRRWRAERGDPRTFDRLIAVLFSEHELRSVGFHRRVKGPVDHSRLLTDLESRFDVVPCGPSVQDYPPRGAFVAAFGGSWFEVIPRSWPTDRGRAGLDVTVLHDDVLDHALGLAPNDPRLEFVSQRTPLAEVAALAAVDGGVVFGVAAPTLDQVIEVADRNEHMPPKSTYFDPKPRSGVFLHLEDQR